MSLILGFIALGLIAGTALTVFWKDVEKWLNNVAADFVERHLGYNARKAMQKAVSTVSKVINKIRNVSIVYSKKNRLDTYYDKTTIIAEQDVYQVNDKVLDEINQKGKIIQEFKYEV